MDEKLIAKLTGYGLQRLQRVKAAADQSDPDMALLDEAIKRLSPRPDQGPPATQEQLASSRDDAAHGAHTRNLARAKAEGQAGQENYQSAGIGEKPYLMPSMPSPYAPPGSPPLEADRPMVQAAGRQAVGTAAGAAQLVPGVSSLVEGIAGRPVLDNAVEAAPSPGVARGTAMLGTYLAGRGALGSGAEASVSAVMKPFTAPYSRILGAAKQVMPNGTVVPHVLAGAGSAGAVALGEAGLRRAAQGAFGNDVSPASELPGELAMPTLAGGAMGMLPGVAEFARKPTSAGGRTAARFASADQNGTRAAVAAEESQVPVAGREPLPPEQRAVKEFKNTMEGAALEGEGRFSMAHNEAEKNWMENTYKPEFDRLVARGDRISPQNTIAKLDDLIASKASQSADGQDPELLSLGRSLKTLRDDLAGYLKPGATLRDYKNAIDQASSMAQQSRTSKVAEKAYGDVERILRDDAYDGFKGFGELSDQHKAFQSNHERQTDIVYGKPEHDAEAYTGAAKQDRGRKFFSQITDETPNVTEKANEVANRSDYGLRSVEDMRGARQAGEARFGEREAVESSKLVGQRGFASPLAMGALAAAEPSPYHAVRAAHSLVGSFHPIQFTRSRLAANMDPEALRLAVPQLLSFTQEVGDARKRVAGLVEAARQHATAP